ncbi:MAG: aldehyde dehydrogenase family protein [Candidatus Iainarchaeum archaeon]|uniref:Aldehyde dehydrogenase family protein n=1 Tax=Candidatus Iainarchaeum sp. TaxID=3101447 RepID=A0A7T9DK83_9ARCH|nr:MAG: aldehyde dehydrogenase family protein [Candidatus Diapherotrites archaeon]
MKEYQNYIHGKWTNSKSRKTFDSLNPATEKSLGAFQLSTKEDVHEAIRAAEKAQPKWSGTPAPKRAEYLFEISRLLKKNKEKLAESMTEEMGKVLKETRGDVQEAIDVFEYMAGEGRRLFGHTTPSELRHKLAFTQRRPIGVVGVITPWNFPLAIPSWKIAPALVCGNAIVFKPSSDTPRTATQLVQIIEEAGIPEGVINMVTGGAQEVGKEIITHEKIRGISFTGSRDTGKWITQNAGIKKIGLELGGKNAIIVMEDADLDNAVEGIIWGAFGTTGQRCTACSRIIVHKNIAKALEEKLVHATKQLRLGNGLEKRTDVGPLINKAAQEKTFMYAQIGRREGRLVCGGKKAEMEGYFFEPTIFKNVKPNARIAQEEIFGPVLSMITVKDLNEAIRVCNGIEYGLSSSIYTQNIQRAMLAIEQIEAGITYVNSSTIGAEVHLPFGGIKQTGNGTREAGIEGIHEFTETKTVYIDYSGRLQKAQGID